MDGQSFTYRGSSIDESILSVSTVLTDGGSVSENILDPGGIVASAFDRYLSGRRLKDILDGYDNVGIVINDNNRPTPSYLVLEHLLKHYDWIDQRIDTIHIATGSHSAPDGDDLRKLLGRSYEILSNRIHIHDARDKESHVSYGRTTAGTPLSFDKALEDHDLLILINSVEPHYFAGYTGGRKTILPGVASYETIEANHSMALDNRARTLGIDGNPVNDDMMESASIYLKGRNYLSVQMIQGPGKLLVDTVIDDDIDRSFRKAVEIANDEFCMPVDRLYDIVVTFSHPPMDRNLYQAQKALENGRLALKKGGVIILVAECSEGIGHSTFWDLLTMSDDHEKIMSRLKSGYKLGYHKAAKIISLVNGSKAFVVSTIDPDELKRGFLQGFSSVEEAVKEARRIMPADPDILVIPDGTVTVPIYQG